MKIYNPNVKYDLSVTGSFGVSGSMVIEADTVITGGLNLLGNSNISGALVTQGDVSIGGTLGSLSSSLLVYGDTNVSGNLSSFNDVIVGGDLKGFGGVINIPSTLFVSGGLGIQGDLAVTGALEASPAPDGRVLKLAGYNYYYTDANIPINGTLTTFQLPSNSSGRGTVQFINSGSYYEEFLWSYSDAGGTSTSLTNISDEAKAVYSKRITSSGLLEFSQFFGNSVTSSLLLQTFNSGLANINTTKITNLDVILQTNNIDYVWAFGLRKINTNYNGSSIRVRNSSNVELDIGFDENGDLDIAALEAHCNGSIGRVTTFYDQSGRGNNLVQTNAGSQPLIVDGSGNTYKLNGAPAIYCGNSMGFASKSGINNITDANFTTFIKVVPTFEIFNTNSSRTILSTNDSGFGIRIDIGSNSIGSVVFIGSNAANTGFLSGTYYNNLSPNTLTHAVMGIRTVGTAQYHYRYKTYIGVAYRRSTNTTNFEFFNPAGVTSFYVQETFAVSGDIYSQFGQDAFNSIIDYVQSKNPIT